MSLNKIKISFLVFLLGFFANQSFAQTKKPLDHIDREVDSLKIKILPPTSIFTKLTGWIKDDTEKWISSPNRIPHNDPEHNIEYYDKYEVGTENIQKIEWASCLIEGHRYGLLIIHSKKYFDKKTEDKELEMMAKIYPAIEYYVMDYGYKDSLKKFIINKKGTSILNLKYDYYGNFGYKSTTQIEKIMKRRIAYNVTFDHPKKSETDQYIQLGFRRTTFKKRNILQFNYIMLYPFIGTKPEVQDFGIYDIRFYEINEADWYQFSKSIR